MNRPRPILTRVDADASPPTMHLLFVDRGKSVRAIDVRIRSSIVGRDPRAVAGMELAAFNPSELDMLYESATLLRDAPGTIPASRSIDRVFRERKPDYSACCPACCHKLGRADSPWLSHLERCPSCGREIQIGFRDGALTIEVRG